MEQLITKLIDERAHAWEEAKTLNDSVQEEARDFTAEEVQTWDRLMGEMKAKDDRVTELEQLMADNKAADEARARFEHVVRPGDDRERGRDLETRVRNWLRGGLPDAEEWSPKGFVVRLTAEDKRAVTEKRDLVKGTTTAGGFTVPTGFVRRLYEHLVEMAAVRQTGASILTTETGESLLVPKTTSHGADAGIIAEGGAITEADPAFGQVTLGAFKYGKLVQASSELILDTAVDLLEYVARIAGQSLGLGSGAHFVTGTGTAGGGGTQPEGVMTNITAGKVMPTGNTLGFTTAGTAADSLFELIHSIVSGYRKRSVWLMNDATLGKARMIRDTTNQYLWQPGLTAGQPDTLLSYPVFADPTVAVFAANAKVAAFGDFSMYYTIRDVAALRFERSDDFAFASDLVTFRALLRTDGRVIDTTAVKSLVASAT